MKKNKLLSAISVFYIVSLLSWLPTYSYYNYTKEDKIACKAAAFSIVKNRALYDTVYNGDLDVLTCEGSRNQKLRKGKVDLVAISKEFKTCEQTVFANLYEECLFRYPSINELTKD